MTYDVFGGTFNLAQPTNLRFTLLYVTNVGCLHQAVFVVCVNLQGLFIFCFHCVRNTTVRSEWKSVVSRIQTYTTSTSNIDPAGSSRSINQRCVLEDKSLASKILEDRMPWPWPWQTSPWPWPWPRALGLGLGNQVLPLFFFWGGG